MPALAEIKRMAREQMNCEEATRLCIRALEDDAEQQHTPLGEAMLEEVIRSLKSGAMRIVRVPVNQEETL